MPHWSTDAVFYHVYALGYCGAPERNDFVSGPESRLRELILRLDSIAELGIDAILLGPVWESGSHGYDTVDMMMVDRRLGEAADLCILVREARRRGMRVVLDAVFNHVGREHPWFLDLRSRRRESQSLSRFVGVDFSRPGILGDGFSYEGWSGCHDLAKLNLDDAATRRELIESALSWIRDFGISGLRMDAADVIDRGFLAELAEACKSVDPDFWLMGEMVHGDYRELAGAGPLDSVTNYECAKGLWSSLKDGNYFEIAWSLKRQFAVGGIYRGIPLYSFVDNHDVDRAASALEENALLYPLYALLFSMPGIPSVYYGSEFGAKGSRVGGSDRALRRPIAEIEAVRPEPALAASIARFTEARKRIPALRGGDYRELFVAPLQFAFERRSKAADAESRCVVALNASALGTELRLDGIEGRFADALDPGFRVDSRDGALRVPVHPRWARYLVASD